MTDFPILNIDPEYYKHRMTTFAGFPYDFAEKNTFDDTEEEREKFFQGLWDNGKFGDAPVLSRCVAYHGIIKDSY